MQNNNIITEQIEPLIKSLKLSTGKHLLNKSWLYFLSALFIILGIALILFMFIMSNVWPFYLLTELQAIGDFAKLGSTKQDVDIFVFLSKGIFGLLGITLIYLGILFNNLNKKNSLIQYTGKQLDSIYTQLQKEIPKETPSNNLERLEPKDIDLA